MNMEAAFSRKQELTGSEFSGLKLLFQSCATVERSCLEPRHYFKLEAMHFNFLTVCTVSGVANAHVHSLYQIETVFLKSQNN